MRVAVVTPYYKEDVSLLERCHGSVVGQSVPCHHVLVADGYPWDEVRSWHADHIILPSGHGDAGNLARGLGGLHALQTGFDYVAYLDADNWYDPEHVETLLELSARKRTCVTTSARKMIRSNGEVRIGGDDFCDGVRMADTNMLFLHRQAYDLISFWATLPVTAAFMGDVLLWGAAKSRGYATAHTGLPTLNYQMRLYTESEMAAVERQHSAYREQYKKDNNFVQQKRVILGFRDRPAGSPDVLIEF